MERKNFPSEEELGQINKYTRRQFASDEVYVFPLTLCDNDIDRDNERFSVNALKKLAELFTGVTGVTDHDPKSDNQCARIFSCKTEFVDGKKTSDGLDYCRLSAKAYMPRTESNSDLIIQLDSGIRKEVSVGCSVAKKICSVCGKETGKCGHVKGRIYDSKKCFVTLDEPTDAYEWSFVAIPAQKSAGVTKSYNKGECHLDIETKLFSGTEQEFSAEEMEMLADSFRTLKAKAADGEAYRRKLEAEINKLAAFTLPELKRDTLDYITSKMSAVQLEELSNALSKKAAQTAPLKPQLSPVKNTKNNYNAFKGI